MGLKISDMAAHTGDPSQVIIPVVVGGVNKKIAASILLDRQYHQGEQPPESITDFSTAVQHATPEVDYGFSDYSFDNVNNSLDLKGHGYFPSVAKSSQVNGSAILSAYSSNQAGMVTITTTASSPITAKSPLFTLTFVTPYDLPPFATFSLVGDDSYMYALSGYWSLVSQNTMVFNLFSATTIPSGKTINVHYICAPASNASGL